MVQKKKKCVFCVGDKKLTKEHIYPNWLKEYLPRVSEKSFHHVSVKGGSIEVGKLNRPGDLLSQRLRIVCSDCNSGWMSRLQMNSKPMLISLLQDDWTEINSYELNSLSAWVSMFCMVSEFSHLSTQVIPQEDRYYLSTFNTCPPSWNIYIGRVDFGSSVHPANINHCAGHIIQQRGLSIIRHPLQTTGFTVGKLLVMAISDPSDSSEIIAMKKAFVEKTDIVNIFHDMASSQKKIIKPKKVYGWNEFYEITNSFFDTLGLPNFSVPK